MNKTFIIAAAFISGIIATQTVATASSVAHLSAGLARIKSGTLASKGYGYSVSQTGRADRAVSQNFSANPNYNPMYTYESRIDGAAGEGGGAGASAGNGGGGGNGGDTGANNGGAVGID